MPHSNVSAIAKRLADEASVNGVGTDALEAPLRNCLKEQLFKIHRYVTSAKALAEKVAQIDVTASILSAMGVEHQIIALLTYGTSVELIEEWLFDSSIQA